MSGVQEMELGMGQIPEVCPRTFHAEEGIVTAQTIKAGGWCSRKYR